jgi:crotonobetainyl-CoA:carnitine CoA-transferase CaiB-like acyl-CoA transferase
VAWLINAGTHYLTSGQAPARLGNAHPNIVPYEVFPTADDYVVLAVGNDAQFRRFCAFAGAPELADDGDYASNDARVRNRDRLVPILRKLTVEHPACHWLAGLEKLNVPCGPVNDLRQVFSDPQVLHRNMIVSLPHALAAEGEVSLIGNPLKFSETPVSYRRGPPVLGEHTEEVLAELLGIEGEELNSLREDATI